MRAKLQRLLLCLTATQRQDVRRIGPRAPLPFVPHAAWLSAGATLAASCWELRRNSGLRNEFSYMRNLPRV